MKRFFKWLGIIIGLLVILTIAGFIVWSQQTYGPSEQLLERVDINSIIDDKDVVIRASGDARAGIILYPGAKVENTAYSYYAKNLAEAGYDVFIPSVLLNFSLLDTEISDKIINENKQITKWYVGGHSLGGVSAAMFAKQHEELVDGLILLASYPTESSNLSTSSLAVLSIYGELDGLTELGDIEQSKNLLPATTRFIEITGGNHAQFGLYGEQKGDGTATLSAIEQQDIIIKETLQWLQ